MIKTFLNESKNKNSIIDLLILQSKFKPFL